MHYGGRNGLLTRLRQTSVAAASLFVFHRLQAYEEGLLARLQELSVGVTLRLRYQVLYCS